MERESSGDPHSVFVYQWCQYINVPIPPSENALSWNKWKQSSRPLSLLALIPLLLASILWRILDILQSVPSIKLPLTKKGKDGSFVKRKCPQATIDFCHIMAASCMRAQKKRRYSALRNRLKDTTSARWDLRWELAVLRKSDSPKSTKKPESLEQLIRLVNRNSFPFALELH